MYLWRRALESFESFCVILCFDFESVDVDIIHTWTIVSLLYIYEK